MNYLLRLSAITAILLAGPFALGQTQTKPADATGQCKDGTYATAASRSGACRGHNGVKEWYAQAPAKDIPAAGTSTTAASLPPATSATPSPTTQVRTQTQSAAQSASQSPIPPATISIEKPAQGSSATPTAGPGPGMVWVNASTKVYHCPGSRFYGKTKSGTYMTEADAKASGAHPGRSAGCTK